MGGSEQELGKESEFSLPSAVRQWSWKLMECFLYDILMLTFLQLNSVCAENELIAVELTTKWQKNWDRNTHEFTRSSGSNIQLGQPQEAMCFRP